MTPHHCSNQLEGARALRRVLHPSGSALCARHALRAVHAHPTAAHPSSHAVIRVLASNDTTGSCGAAAAGLRDTQTDKRRQDKPQQAGRRGACKQHHERPWRMQAAGATPRSSVAAAPAACTHDPSSQRRSGCARVCRCGARALPCCTNHGARTRTRSITPRAVPGSTRRPVHAAAAAAAHLMQNRCWAASSTAAELAANTGTSQRDPRQPRRHSHHTHASQHGFTTHAAASAAACCVKAWHACAAALARRGVHTKCRCGNH